ncbi:hypothetical protein BBO_06764 [Beauveria brongniartii RCEF 3172]|uniref:Uncharacterized protein n=1 Tax=Beauveria brongniartii RCEF 3172 TaxID=1081107 RepID=A0A167AUF0_9HYPO|nr:hypothetical protein BBO_06764 [Beauveria brongniartii RCEF 3172]
MAITDGTGQSSVAPPPQERLMKACRLVNGYDSDSNSSDCNDGKDCNDDNDGNDNGNNTKSRQYDDANVRPGQSHEGDTTVNVERPSKDSVSLELEISRGSGGLAWQTSKKRIAPNGGQSDNGSDADLDVPSRIKPSDEPDHTTLADSACGNNYPVQSLASLLADLQCIREYRTSAPNKGGTPYFEICIRG